MANINCNNGIISSCNDCLQRKYSPLNALSKEELNILNSKRKSQHVKKGTPIFISGEYTKGLICLSTGKAKISIEDKLGNSQIVSLKKEVDFLGLHELMSDSKYRTNATAITDVSVCIIDKREFYSVIKNNADFSIKIIKILSNELGRIERRTIKLTQKYMRVRLAETIFELTNIYGYVKKEERLLNVEMKRKELAKLSNMTTANLIRTLSVFVEEGIVKTKRRKIWIKNIKALKKVTQEVS